MPFRFFFAATNWISKSGRASVTIKCEPEWRRSTPFAEHISGAQTVSFFLTPSGKPKIVFTTSTTPRRQYRTIYYYAIFTRSSILSAQSASRSSSSSAATSFNRRIRKQAETRDVRSSSLYSIFAAAFQPIQVVRQIQRLQAAIVASHRIFFFIARFTGSIVT